MTKYLFQVRDMNAYSVFEVEVVDDNVSDERYPGKAFASVICPFLNQGRLPTLVERERLFDTPNEADEHALAWFAANRRKRRTRKVTKKVRDLTAGEINRECQKHSFCQNCPLKRQPSLGMPNFCDIVDLTADELNTEITLEVKE